MEGECLELVVYEVRSGLEREHDRAHAQVIEEIQRMDGFRGVRILRSIDDPRTRVDEIAWASAAHARAAHAAFRDLPGAAPFLATVAKVFVSLRVE